MKKSILLVVCSLLLSTNSTFGQEYAEFDTALLTAIRDTSLAAEAPGIVQQIRVEPGSDVQISDVIVELNKESFEAELRVALAEKAVAEIEAANDVNVKFAAKTFEVNQKLLSRSELAREQYTKAITQTDMDRLQLELEQSRLSQRQALLQLQIAKQTTSLKSDLVEVAELRLANRDIKAPIAGRIEQVFVQQGQWVNAGAPIFRIVDLTSLRVKAIFPVQNYLQIKKGNLAEFSYQIGNQEFGTKGSVTFVNSVIRDNVFQVWVDIDNSDRSLIPGVQGKLRVELRDLKRKN